MNFSCIRLSLSELSCYFVTSIFQINELNFPCKLQPLELHKTQVLLGFAEAFNARAAESCLQSIRLSFHARTLVFEL